MFIWNVDHQQTRRMVRGLVVSETWEDNPDSTEYRPPTDADLLAAGLSKVTEPASPEHVTIEPSDRDHGKNRREFTSTARLRELEAKERELAELRASLTDNEEHLRLKGRISRLELAGSNLVACLARSEQSSLIGLRDVDHVVSAWEEAVRS